MLDKLINKVIGDPNERLIKKIQPLVHQINDIEEQYQQELTEADIPKKTEEFIDRIAKSVQGLEGEEASREQARILEEILPEAFALVKFACRKLVGKQWQVRGETKTWDMVPFDVQLLGGIVLHNGNIAEMKTGEGKTLVCTFPAYLNALTKKGVFVVTVNDYLATRDAEWMAGLYEFLGLTVGTIHHGQSRADKKAAYACDIIYGTNNEFGFDYLRDNMATNLDNVVQRNLHYAIVDEVDSILIDEARTPLIISAPAQESTMKYKQYATLINKLEENVHYNIDEKAKTALLSEEGISKMEELLGVDNIYTDAGFSEVHHIEQALKAQTVFKKDIDYVVKEGEIVIVDEFTGRLMSGRRYSNGLHQAIEAKEGVEIKRESRTLATITFQNYFRIFEKLSGMTGTAITEAEEFAKIYGLDTYAIPTNRPIARDDKHDSIYKNVRGKFIAIAKRTKELHEKGQPVLIGTVSIEKSEALSNLLRKEGVPHNVLNAKHHEKEAEIVANAGQKGAVTIATNMAGRGTDIKLGEGVKEIGGLCVIGTERHESRRIDNQLRGRSGRQGDPGYSQFYVSMEDDLMRLFGADRIKKMMEVMKIPDDMPIENRTISRSIEGAQKKVEGHHFDVRKHIVEYDDVMNKHREIIYARRRKILDSSAAALNQDADAPSIKNDIILIIEKEAEAIVLNHTQGPIEEWDYQEIFETINALHKDPVYPISLEDLKKIITQEELIEMIKKYLFAEYDEREKLLPNPGIMRELERNVYLRVIDTYWMEHIDQMSHLRERVSLQGYGQRDPLMAYKQEGFEMLERLLSSIETSTVNTLFKIDLKQQLAVAQQAQQTKSQESESNSTNSSSANTASSVGSLPDETPENLQTNEAQIEANLTGGKPTQESSKPDSKYAETNPNDPCPCGSGKKFKKCHG